MTLLFAVALALCVAAVPQPVAAGIGIFVDSTGDGVNTGSGNVCDDGTGHCTLRAAIQLVNARNNGGDGISISVTGTITLNSALPNLSTPVSIDGPGADQLTVQTNISGIRIFNVTTSGTVTFSGITISGGNVSNANGGGIQNASTGTVNITNCTLSNNSCSGGSFGGGGGVYSFGTLTVTGTTITNNTAVSGGGIACAGSGTITNSTLNGNFADGDSADPPTGGGGIAITGNGPVNVINSTITGNGAFLGDNPGGGGGIWNDGGTLSVTNSTLSNNTVFGKNPYQTLGGGIRIENAGPTNVKSSIIATNSADLSPDVYGDFTSAGFNLIGKIDGSTGFNTATDQTGTITSPLDPKFDTNGLQNNGGPTYTIALLPGSPAIDKGTRNGLTGNLSTDQRGVGYSRTVDDPSIPNAFGGDGTDIGAFEFGAHIDAVSRKTHGSKDFDVSLPLSGPVGIECRKGGGTNSDTHQVIMTFPVPVTVGSASATPDPKPAPPATGSVSGFSVNGSQVTVNLTGVSNAQTIVITLFGVSDGTNTNNVSVPMGVLLGDVNGTRRVDANDVTQVRQNNFAPLTQDPPTFREDVNVSGRIDAQDVTITRQQNFTFLP